MGSRRPCSASAPGSSSGAISSAKSRPTSPSTGSEPGFGSPASWCPGEILAAIKSQIQGPTSFYVLRFLLGAAEAGFFPGVILYLSYWFPARQRAAAVSLFMASAPLSTALGSPFASTILGLNGALGLAGWQWLFILEAIPAVLLGFVTLATMTDRPEQAKWLAEDERVWLVSTMNAERAGKAATETRSVWRALADPRVLGLALVYFGTSAGLYTLGVWAPQIIKSFGLPTSEVGLLNALPPAVAVVCMVLWSRHSDRTNERPWHVIIACLAAAVGLILAGLSPNVVAVVAALVLVNVGNRVGQAAAVEHADDVPVGAGRRRRNSLRSTRSGISAALSVRR